MAKTAFTVAVSSANESAFRAYLTALHGAITAIGLIQTSHPGQAVPATQPLADCFLIYRFPDALAPVYVRFDVSSTAYAATTVRVGGSIDAAGVITDGASVVVSNSVGNSGAGTSYMCYKNGSFSWFLPMGATASWLGIGRSSGSTGEPTGDHVTLVQAGRSGAGAVGSSQTVELTGLVHPKKASLPFLAPDGATWATGLDVGISPIFPIARSIAPPVQCAVVGCANDWSTPGSTATFALYGLPRTWLVLPSVGIYTSQRLLMLWED